MNAIVVTVGALLVALWCVVIVITGVAYLINKAATEIKKARPGPDAEVRVPYSPWRKGQGWDGLDDYFDPGPLPASYLPLNHRQDAPQATVDPMPMSTGHGARSGQLDAKARNCAFCRKVRDFVRNKIRNVP